MWTLLPQASTALGRQQAFRGKGMRWSSSQLKLASVSQAAFVGTCITKLNVQSFVVCYATIAHFVVPLANVIDELVLRRVSLKCVDEKL